MIGTKINLVCDFWSIANGGTLIDRFTLESNLQLTIGRQANTMRISWPTNGAEGVALESPPTLFSAPWRRVAQTPSVSGGSNVITLAATNQQQFLRLRR